MKLPLLLALSSLLAAGSALAVEYALPTNGWYQLQDPVTYAELCTSSDALCDVPPGTYRLINHSLNNADPMHVQTITIEGDVIPPTTATYKLETTIVSTDCLYGFPGRPLPTDADLCIAQCPDSYSLTGGSCRATREDSFVDFGPDGYFGRETTVRISTLEEPTPTSYSCDLDMEADYLPNMEQFVANNFTRTEVTAIAICSTIVSQ